MIKDLIKNIYAAIFNESLVQTVTVECPVIPIPPKTNREKLIEISTSCYNTDPTPKDEQPDEYACVHSLTTIIKKLYPDFPIMTYTPTFLAYLRGDKRFKETTEWKEGNIIISSTGTGNGTIVGHTGIIGKDGKIYSNASSTGLWSDKFDTVTWIERYSRKGGLDLRLFEVL